MIDPFPEGDLVTYLEMARLAVKRMPMGIRVDMDLSYEEVIRLQKQLVAYLSKKSKKVKKLFVVLHTHRHGISMYPVRASKKPTDKELIKKFEIDFEPDREEFIEVEEFTEITEM